MTPIETRVVADFADRGSPSSMATRDEHSPEPASSVLSDEGLMNTYGHAVEGDNDGPSAADYDPTMDIVEDQIRIKQRLAKTGDGETQPVADSAQDASPDEAADEEGGGGFDMFAEEFDEERYAAERKKRSKVPGPQRGLLEGDDKDGYYKIRIGQLFHDRYELKATLGQGAFARVARATDTVTNKTVALKIIRNNYALRRAAYKEIAIVHKLNERDAANKKHIVRIDHSFEVDGHVCMVFEDMDMNLREVLRKFGHNVGISLHATRRFAWQIFTALEHMRKSHVIHADLKPDNILVCTVPSDASPLPLATWLAGRTRMLTRTSRLDQPQPPGGQSLRSRRGHRPGRRGHGPLGNHALPHQPFLSSARGDSRHGLRFRH